MSDQLSALFSARFFEDGATRYDDIAARTVHFENGEGLFLAHKRHDIAHRTNIDLRAWQEARSPVHINGKAAFDAPDNSPHNRLTAIEDFFKTGPGLFATGFFTADDGFAHGVFDALEIDLDLRAGLKTSGIRSAEFLERNTAFGFQTDINNDEIFFDPDNETVNDLAFEHVAAMEAFIKQGRKIVAAWVKGVHKVSDSGLATRRN